MGEPDLGDRHISASSACRVDMGLFRVTLGRELIQLCLRRYGMSWGARRSWPAQDGLGLAAAGAGLPLLGWKQPGPEGLAQNPGGQVQAAPFQCSMIAAELTVQNPTAQALTGESAATARSWP